MDVGGGGGKVLVEVGGGVSVAVAVGPTGLGRGVDVPAGAGVLVRVALAAVVAVFGGEVGAEVGRVAVETGAGVRLGRAIGSRAVMSRGGNGLKNMFGVTKMAAVAAATIRVSANRPAASKFHTKEESLIVALGSLVAGEEGRPAGVPAREPEGL